MSVGQLGMVGALVMMSVLGAGKPEITGIKAYPDRLVVHISGGAGQARLMEMHVWETRGRSIWYGSLGDKDIAIPRFLGQRDRLYDKFQLVDAATGKPLGPPHWVDDLSGIPAWNAPIDWPKSKKGVTCPVDLPDLKTTGVKYTDTNILLRAVVDLGDKTPRETWEVDGEKIPINTNYISVFDKQIKQMNEMGINVTIILLNSVPTKPEPDNPFINPRTDLAHAPFHLGAFNLTDRRGYIYYRAVLEYLAHRYSNPAGPHGFVSGYIIGNEIQSHWAWDNMGRATPQDVTREYADALRVAWLAVRRYSTRVRVYVSMDQTWATHLDPDPMKSMRGDQFLERLNRRTTAEGNYPWNVAFHPYPENLFDPRFWNDKTAVMGFDTPRITFKNLEVLPAFLAQKQFLYEGNIRHIILSEEGFNCMDQPDGEKLQAAAYAAAYYKVSHMPRIDAFILHRQVDFRGEGGLHLGLWTRKPGTQTTPGRRRMIWYVFRAAGTPDWKKAFAFALPIIGIKSWKQDLPHAGPIPARSGVMAPALDPATLIYNLQDHMGEAKVTNCLDWRPAWAKGPKGRLYPTMFQHPPDPKKGVGEAAYEVKLPAVEAGEKIVLRFGTVITGPTLDGVQMSILVDGDKIFSETQTKENQPKMHEVDMTKWAGKTVEIVLRVNALKNNGADWSNWMRPVVVLEK